MWPGGVSVIPARYTADEKSNFRLEIGVVGFFKSSSINISAILDKMLKATPTMTLEYASTIACPISYYYKLTMSLFIVPKNITSLRKLEFHRENCKLPLAGSS
jgi:hypothetical protein